jgi:hypothetical protein
MAKKAGSKINARQGTIVWGINALRSDGLTRLLDDLVDLENTGLEQKQCAHVKTALSKITGHAAAIPDGSFWRGTIYQEFEAFADVYEQWNSREGVDAHAIAHRKEHLRKLRWQRNRLATRIRLNQFVLQNELDLELIENMYIALGDLAKSLPEIFKSLAEAVARYERRRVSPA